MWMWPRSRLEQMWCILGSCSSHVDPRGIYPDMTVVSWIFTCNIELKAIRLVSRRKHTKIGDERGKSMFAISKRLQVSQDMMR